MDYSFLDSNKIVPVVVLKELKDTIPTLTALLNGGISCAEITFRTACAKDAIALATKQMPNMFVGAGTVINAEQCRQAISAGAKFIVSPGFSMGAFEVCKEFDIPYIPGVVTPTEIINAKECGLSILKFFPAGVFGGAKALKALSSAFPDVKFLPTGGVDENNLKEFMSLPCVVAIGGSFMFKNGIDGIEEKSRTAIKMMEEL